MATPWDKKTKTMSESNIIIYQTEDGETKIETRLENAKIHRESIIYHYFRTMPK